MALTVTPKENLSYRTVKHASVSSAAQVNVTGGAVTVYGITIVNGANTTIHTCFLDGSVDTTAAVGTTAPTMIFGVPTASTRTMMIPEGVTFSGGMNIWTKQEPGTAGASNPAGGTVTVYVTTGV